MVTLTPSQTVGPFFGFALPYRGQEQLVAAGDPDAINITGRVFDGADDPVTDALVEIWQANRFGRYRHPADTRAEIALEEGFSGFGRSCTDTEGRFWFNTVKPGSVPGPEEGTRQAPHINVSVFARGLLNRVCTRIYFPDERDANSSDPVLQAIADPRARASLIANPIDGGLVFDIHLQGDSETAFFAV